MNITEIKNLLANADTVTFKLPSGDYVPEHFHVTEVGVVTKHFIDCGGTVREEKVANFQLWNANDFEHRLKPGKLLNIIALSEKILGMEDLEIEVEYQSDTIGKYDLHHGATGFELKSKFTACLAEENCGIPTMITHKLSELQTQASSCTPGSGCC